MTTTRTSRTRLAAGLGAAGLAAAGLLALTGGAPSPRSLQLAGTSEDVSGPCDEVEHASDPRCTSTPSTVGTPSPGAAPAPSGEVRTVAAADAGTVVVTVDGTTLQVLEASPASGWRAVVERASGREVEVTFRAGARRVDVNVELEDGEVREWVRVRDDFTGTDTRTEDGVVDDHSGRSAQGSDDGPGDDSGSHGSDDSPGDDSGSHGSDDSPGDGSGDDSGGHGAADSPGRG